MSRPPAPVFLERRGYRRRRLRDAARILPVVGALLFLVPLLWAPDPGTAADTARGGIYVFVVWAGLIGLAAWMARPLSDSGDADGPGGSGGPGAAGAAGIPNDPEAGQ